MDSRNVHMGDNDWDEMNMYSNTSQFDDGMPADSPYGNSAFHDFTNIGDSYDSPSALTMRTPSKSGPDGATGSGAQQHQHPHPQGQAMASTTSLESSSQDSSSDSSSRRKRKTGTDSPESDPVAEMVMQAGVSQLEDVKMVGGMHNVRSFDHQFAQPMNDLSLEQAMGNGTMGQFDFGSAASSPIQAGDFNSAMSLDAHVRLPAANGAAQFNQTSDMQTINPGMFAVGSRDQSPANMIYNQASPHAIFSTPSSDSQETYSANPTWTTHGAQNPTWPGDFANQLASPNGMTFTPSPGANGASAQVSHGQPGRAGGRSPLHIAPISTKSRVETQINVVMTLEQPAPGTEFLHLPLHTIAKSKLLAKEDVDRSKVLELHTMLVCTSAMHNPQAKEKALARAAAQNNDEIQRRAEMSRGSSDEEKNDGKSVEEADKPANGGEVRICSNCIQRERKRAGRKKTKREEEQQHWERYETERVVVFNSNEYLPFKLCDQNQHQRDGGMGMDVDPYIPPDGALSVTAAMRIACYCRHQSEKEGFQVIFTLKDSQGNVKAQAMSDSILITDDHKTHPQSFSTSVAGDAFYQNPAFVPNGLPMSQSMVDMSTHVQPFPSSRSAGNLQALGYGAQYNGHSHVHQLSGSGFMSHDSSATMTPTSLSRPASPSNAGAGPNKKRKSSSFHRKIPSGLAMTPRVDTSLPPSNSIPSSLSMGSQFSPEAARFPNQLSQMDQAYMAIPNSGPAQYFGSGPPTPSENGPFNFSQPQVDLSRIPSNQAYFSHPSSAVPSRASSPVLQTRANMAAYARQQPIQTSTNTIGARYMGQAPPGSSGNDSSQGPYPAITRITPNEGPTTGGTEVAVFGESLVPGVQVAFGDIYAPTQYISPTSVVTIAPPGRAGSVHLALIPPPGAGPYPAPSSRTIFRYTAYNEEMMVMALKFLSEQQYGNSDAWQSLAQSSANSFAQSRRK